MRLFPESRCGICHTPERTPDDAGLLHFFGMQKCGSLV